MFNDTFAKRFNLKYQIKVIRVLILLLVVLLFVFVLILIELFNNSSEYEHVNVESFDDNFRSNKEKTYEKKLQQQQQQQQQHLLLQSFEGTGKWKKFLTIKE